LISGAIRFAVAANSGSWMLIQFEFKKKTNKQFAMLVVLFYNGI
jgi:hypothetical protein